MKSSANIWLAVVAIVLMALLGALALSDDGGKDRTVSNPLEVGAGSAQDEFAGSAGDGSSEVTRVAPKPKRHEERRPRRGDRSSGGGYFEEEGGRDEPVPGSSADWRPDHGNASGSGTSGGRNRDQGGDPTTEFDRSGNEVVASDVVDSGRNGGSGGVRNRGDGNNGHGNDDDGHDESNPGKGSKHRGDDDDDDDDDDNDDDDDDDDDGRGGRDEDGPREQPNGNNGRPGAGAKSGGGRPNNSGGGSEPPNGGVGIPVSGVGLPGGGPVVGGGESSEGPEGSEEPEDELDFDGLPEGGIPLTGLGGDINGGQPVPIISDDEESIEFLAEVMKRDYGGTTEQHLKYAEELAKTLAQLTPAEQRYIFYGF